MTPPKKKTPRYNILSCRVSDEELEKIKSKNNRKTLSSYLLDAIREKIQREDIDLWQDDQVQQRLKKLKII